MAAPASNKLIVVEHGRQRTHTVAAATDNPNEGFEFVERPRHVVHKAQTRTLDPFSEVGTTGLRQFGGYVLEEWLSQLAGRKAAWVWREMMDNDPIVGAILFCIRWMAQTVEWRVDEGGDPAAAQFVEECMHDMDRSWGDTISEILSFLPYGWHLAEEVYKRRQGPQPDPPWDPERSGLATSEDDSFKASSRYTDGKIGWRKMSGRAQETLLRWHFDGYSTPVAMEQVDSHGGQHIIPLAKGLLFRTRTSRNNPEGYSILRNSVTSYWAIKNVKALEGIGIERDLAGVPVATPPEGVDLYSQGNSALLGKVQRMVTALRNDEYAGIVLPSAGWDLKLMTTGGSRQFDTDKVIRRYRQDMATSMLAEFVLIGQDAVGSYALAEVKSDLFGIALDGILDLMCEVFNRQAIPRLLRLNGMDVTDPPQIAHGSARKIDLDRVGGFLQAISLAGAPIPWSVELLKALFADAGLPTNFEEQRERADELPAAPEKVDPQDELQGERVAAEQQRAALVQKAEHRKVTAGTVVDVGEHLGDRHRLLSGQLEAEIHAALAELGEQAATAFLTVAQKANAPSSSTVHRLVARVLRALNLQAWIRNRLAPILRNHAGRVTADTLRTIHTEIGLEVSVAERDAQRIADQAGTGLGMRDIEPQVRAAILDAIRRGLDAGDAPSKTAQRIREQVPAGRFVHAGPKYRAALISKTETAAMMRAAALAAYRSNPHITHVQLRDGIYGPPRSDADCIARDGEVVPVDEAEDAHPLHPQCTLSFLPVVTPAAVLTPPRELATA